MDTQSDTVMYKSFPDHTGTAHRGILVTVILVISLCAFGIILWATNYSKQIAAERLIEQAELLASFIHPDTVGVLNGVSSDEQLLEYKQLNAQLQYAIQRIPRVRFMYVMKQVHGRIIFIADSELPASPQVATYGQTYYESSPWLYRAFIDGKPFIEGPIHDRWGHWISAHAPIKNKQGQVVALVGIDIDAQQWQTQMWKYGLMAFAMCVIVVLFVAVSFFYYNMMNKWKHAEARNRFYMMHDGMTGLHNRFYIQEALNNVIERCQRTGSRMAVLHIDIQGLKQINDTHGHQVGDEVLVEAAQRIRALVRTSDHVARLAGDEFVVVLDAILEEIDADSVSKKIQMALSAPMTLSSLHYPIEVAACVGIAIYPQHGDSVDHLLSYAATDMYEQKSRRKSI